MTAQPAPAQQLVFLLGSPHSGAQWVQLLLAQHPELATAAATELFSHYLLPLLTGDAQPASIEPAGAEQAPAKRTRPVGFPGLLRPEEYRRFVTGAAAVALRRIAASKPKARVLLEASPGHARVWRDILRYYPEARFIHVIRDPREVVASMMQDAAMARTDEDPLGLVETVLAWQQEVDAIRDLVEDSRRCHEIRYENLQRNPVEVLRNLLGWIGLPGSSEHCMAFVRRLSDHSAAARGLPWQEGETPRNGAGRSKGRLGAREIACIELVARETMIRYEYELQGNAGERRARLRLAAHRLLRIMEEGAHNIRQRL